jgi:hypothetical protein
VRELPTNGRDPHLRRPARLLSEEPFEISSCIITNEIIRAKAISSCFLKLYSPTPRRTGTFSASSSSVGCSSTVIGKRYEDRAPADPVGGLLPSGIALPGDDGSETHDRGKADRVFLFKEEFLKIQD